MSFVNIIARAELKEDLYVNDVLTCDNVINTKNLTISGNINLLNDATFDGTFIKDFVETDSYIDENGDEVITTESIDLYEKVLRIESKIDINTLAHSTNAAAISSRYTKTASDLRFVNNTDAKITGDINIRASETDPYETLATILNGKVNTETLNDYTTTSNLNTELEKKVDVQGFAETYTSHLAPLESPSFTGTVLINDFDIVNAINTNSNNIQSNLDDIHTNSNAIFDNRKLIETNSNAIFDNMKLIQTNSNDIFDNKKLIETNSNDIFDNANAIQTNSNNIQTNATAIATKEDIDTLKVMINMLAMSVQPNYILIDIVTNINSRLKFARNDQEAANLSFTSLNFTKSIFTSTEEFLKEFYSELGMFIQNLSLNYASQYQTNESGTNGDSTGGFFYKHKKFEDFPTDIASYKIYWEDDYVCNKAGLLSMPQILRTGQLTYTLVDSQTYTITAQYPHFTI